MCAAFLILVLDLLGQITTMRAALKVGGSPEGDLCPETNSSGNLGPGARRHTGSLFSLLISLRHEGQGRTLGSKSSLSNLQH